MLKVYWKYLICGVFVSMLGLSACSSGEQPNIGDVEYEAMTTENINESCNVGSLVGSDICSGSGGKIFGSVGASTKTAIILKVNGKERRISLQYGDNNWNNGWTIPPLEISQSQGFTYEYSLTDADSDSLLQNVIIVCYDQEGKKILPPLFSKGYGTIPFISKGDSQGFWQTQNDFQGISGIFPVAYFGATITNGSDISDAPYYYMLPPIHFQQS